MAGWLGAGVQVDGTHLLFGSKRRRHPSLAGVIDYLAPAKVFLPSSIEWLRWLSRGCQHHEASSLQLGGRIQDTAYSKGNFLNIIACDNEDWIYPCSNGVRLVLLLELNLRTHESDCLWNEQNQFLWTLKGPILICKLQRHSQTAWFIGGALVIGSLWNIC